MGEVYRATDMNLGRQVAIKVLPEAFAQDAERLARFEREAKTLAALNHPNIAQIYGLERSGGTPALVMELDFLDPYFERQRPQAAATPEHERDNRDRTSALPLFDSQAPSPSTGKLPAELDFNCSVRRIAR
jgi:hypothetical protein